MNKSTQKVMIESLAKQAGMEVVWEHFHVDPNLTKWKRIEWYGASFRLNGIEVHKRYMKYLQPKQSYALYNVMDGIKLELRYLMSLARGC